MSLTCSHEFTTRCCRRAIHPTTLWPTLARIRVLPNAEHVCSAIHRIDACIRG